MKKFYILTLLTFITFTTVNAQDFLDSRNLIDGLHPAEQQFIFKDLLRYRTDGWVVEIRGANAEWKNIERHISLKYNDKSFKEVRFESWNNLDNKWEMRFFQTYNTSTKNKPTTILREYDNAVFNRNYPIKDIYTFTYNGNLLESRVLERSFENRPYQKIVKNTYQYVSNYLLLIDSSSILDSWGRYYVTEIKRYSYDLNGNLTKTVKLARPERPRNSPFDTSWYTVNTYDSLNRITSYRVYNSDYILQDVIRDQGGGEYKYNSLGFLSEVTFSYRHEPIDSIITTYRYNQYYDSNKTLTALTKKLNISGNNWQFIDSISLKYTAKGLFDTSFSYQGTQDIRGNWKWSAGPSYRYIFNKTSALSINKADRKLKSIKIYPNPTKDKLYIEAELKSSTEGLKIDIFNSLGQKVHSKNYHSNGVLLNTLINITHLPAGIYFLKIGGLTKKFVKE